MVGYEIRKLEDKGRALFATVDFKEGDTILDEVPLVSSQFSWNAACKYLACEYCLKPLETAEENFNRLSGHKGSETITLPYADYGCRLDKQNQTKCQDCSTRYCSQECLNIANERYHRFLCLASDYDNPTHPLNVLNEVWKKIHYPPETTTILLIVKLIAMYKQSEDKEALFNAIQEFQHEFINENLMITHKMLGEKHQHNLDELFAVFEDSIDFTGIEMFRNLDCFKRLFALIGINGQGIGTSSFADWAQCVSGLSLEEDERMAITDLIDSCYAQLEEGTGLEWLNIEGSALYSIGSKANHSCVPNAQTSFPHSNHNLHLKAIRDIQCGEEICISYLDDCFLSRSRHSRRKELRENYLFMCTCQKCEAQKDDEDVTSDEEMDDDDEEMD
ncbi:histone-lysine N-trimethyltransferase SMYD5 [Sitodiplosis mosellana]|uniref:histone-lysine N-trimethyltransferase SMYD5 n=1 Tax=Sitodiplosis mosellana TaxID=263140 RepID=UPI002443C6AF|nr:histone-lysine N-trimethyltransferase SMYD5 [Sitodiplosis mosellana]